MTCYYDACTCTLVDTNVIALVVILSIGQKNDFLCFLTASNLDILNHKGLHFIHDLRDKST